MSFVAFLATEYDEVLLGYHSGQIVERWKNQRFEDHLCPRPQGTSLIMAKYDIVMSYCISPDSSLSRGQLLLLKLQ